MSAREVGVPPSFEQAVQELAKRLVPDWTVAVEAAVGDYPVIVSLTHPVSAGYEWKVTRAELEAEDLATLAAMISGSPDLAVPPPLTSNSELLRGLRTVIKAFNWPPEQVSALAGVLEDARMLTTEERSWLRRVSGGQ